MNSSIINNSTSKKRKPSIANLKINIKTNIKKYKKKNNETSPITVTTNLYNNQSYQSNNQSNFNIFNNINTILNDEKISNVLNNENKNIIRHKLLSNNANRIKNSENTVYHPLLSKLNGKINFSDFRIIKNSNKIFSGIHSVVYILLQSKNKLNLDFVLKIVDDNKIKKNNSITKKIIEEELYGFLINYMIIKKLNENNKQFFSDIYEFGIATYLNNEKKLYSIMEKCNCDALEYFNNLDVINQPKIINNKINYNKFYILMIIFIRFVYYSLKAMVLLHSLGYTHLDIKPENILVKIISKNPEFKLSDFSTLTKIDEEFDIIKGTKGYMSPVLIYNLYKNKKTINNVIFDYYSLGITLLSIIIQLFPIKLNNSQNFHRPYPRKNVNVRNLLIDKIFFYKEFIILNNTIDKFKKFIHIFNDINTTPSEIIDFYKRNINVFNLFYKSLKIILVLIVSNNPLVFNNINNINNINTNNKSKEILKDFYNNLKDINYNSEIMDFINTYEKSL